jgi:acyl carrier protein
MRRTDIDATIQKVVETTLDIRLEPTEDLERKTSWRWDSFHHVAMLFAIEEEFGIYIEETFMAKLNSISAIRTAVLERVQVDD